MRILWVKVGGLWPLDTGGRLRSFHILSELSRRHRVTLLTTHGPDDDPAGMTAALPDLEGVVSLPFVIPKRLSLRFAAALLRSWASPLPVDLRKFRCASLTRETRRRLASGEADLCVADFLSATVNVPHDGPVPLVFFAHNVEHLIWKRLARVEPRLLRRLLLAIEWRKMRRAESRVCARSRLTLAVSDTDRDLLRALAPGAAIRAVPTGVDTGRFAPRPGAGEPERLVLTGSMDWHPNEDAVRYFIDAVLPRLRREAPGVLVDVVGRNPSPRLRAAGAAAGVRVTGTVGDVRPYLAAAAVCVVPLRIGGGTRLKIFEALAMGKAVVSTTIGAEGLPLAPGVHFVQADGPERLAGEIVALLRDPDRRRRLGEAGRRLVETRYSWHQVGREFESRLREAVPSGAPRMTVAARGAATLARRAVHPAVMRTLRASFRLGPPARRTYWRLQIARLLGPGTGGPIPPRAPVRSLLFVCQGNIIRSPMAAALMRRRLAELGAGTIAVRSAGLHAEPGRSADGRAEMVAAEFGVSLRGHRARPLTPDLVRCSDLILAMDTINQAEILTRHPGIADRVRLMGSAGTARGGRAVEIADPFTGGAEDVRCCYRLLETCVGSLAARIAPPAPGPSPEVPQHAG
ncbi:MAG: glycosyltransferase [Candidatus Polarisedimenticolia bacterium]